ALALVGSTVCVAGRYGVLAIDSTGAVTGWHPEGVGRVWALALKDSVLYVGGEFATIAGSVRPNLAGLTITHLNVPPSPPPPLTVNELQLAPSVPNPVRDEALIQFWLPTSSATDLRVLDVQGRIVATLLDHARQDPGWHKINLSTTRWRRGVYLCRLEVDGI